MGVDMRIIVTGLECSGTKWMTELLKSHPRVRRVVHTSIPEFSDSRCRFPDLTEADAIVWMIRYEPFRLRSVEARGYDNGRALNYIPPELYAAAKSCYLEYRKIVCVSYEGLVGPLGTMVLKNLFEQLGLCPFCYPMRVFNPKDENAKYLITEPNHVSPA